MIKLLECNTKVSDIHYSANERYIICDSDSKLQIWNLQSGKLVQSLVGHSD